MLLKMEEIKLQLRLDDDFSDEDELLELLGKAAQSRTENFLNRKLYATADDRPADDPDGLVISDDVKLALLLLVSHFYENRSTVIKDAINAVPALPFTASSSAGVVTLTARHKGLCGNEIPVSLNYYGFGGGEVLPAGVQIAVATGTAGTGAPVLTGAVAAMADEPFDYIGLPFNDTASVNTLVSKAGYCAFSVMSPRTGKTLTGLRITAT